jgi:hypothetical protein
MRTGPPMALNMGISPKNTVKSRSDKKSARWLKPFRRA